VNLSNTFLIEQMPVVGQTKEAVISPERLLPL